MKKFIILTATLFFATISFSQKIVKYQDFSKINKAPQPKLLKAIKEKSTNLNITWQESFDTASTGTNGLPTNWTYTPNSSNIDDQWQWYGTSPNGYIGRTWYANTTINEEFYTDFHTVPDNNPAFYFDFACSFYYFHNSNDSLDIFFSTDTTNQWTKIWSNKDSSDIVNSIVNWPYTNWDWHTAKILLNDSLAGNDIRFKFVFHGDMGNGFYIDNVMLVGINNYDADMSSCVVLNSYTTSDNNTFLDGFYQLLPIYQKREFSTIKAIVKNCGKQPLNNLSLTTVLKDTNENIIAYKDTNIMNNGQDLVNYSDIDTFECSGFNNFAPNVGKYILETTISADSIDEDTTNNIFSVDLEYTYGGMELDYSSLARATTVTTEVSLDDYSISELGDELGIAFYVSHYVCLAEIGIKLGYVTDNTSFKLRLYKWDTLTSSLIYIDQTDFYSLSESDSYSTKYAYFVNNNELDIDTKYMITAVPDYTPNVSSVSFAAFDGFKDFYSDYSDNSYYGNYYYRPASVFLHTGTYYYIKKIPCFKVNFICTDEVKEMDSEQKINIYPNPANNTLNIEFENIQETNDNIQIYNTIGELVKEMSYNQSVDISDLEKGIYFIKIGNYSNKFVKL